MFHQVVETRFRPRPGDAVRQKVGKYVARVRQGHSTVRGYVAASEAAAASAMEH